MITRILTICAAFPLPWRLSRLGTSLAQAQGYRLRTRRGLLRRIRRSDYRRAPGVPDYDSLDDQDGPDAQSSTALPPPGPVLSPDDPRYGRPGSPGLFRRGTDRPDPFAG